MLNASADQRVLGYLGRALSLELSAVQLYTTQAQLVAAWGLREAAETLRKEATEEMDHVERVISRMLALGGAPNASQLRPVRLGQNLRELLLYNHAFESELVRLYEDATHYCTQVGDSDNRVFFEGILAEERHHGEEFAQWLAELEQSDSARPRQTGAFNANANRRAPNSKVTEGATF